MRETSGRKLHNDNGNTTRPNEEMSERASRPEEAAGQG